MKKLVGLVVMLVLSLAGSLQAGDWNGYATAYGTYMNFNSSEVKDDGWVATAYLSLGDGEHNTFEWGLSQTHIDYKQTSDLDQTDFTIVYTNSNQLLPNHAFSFGFHYINTDDDLTDQGKIYFFKATYFQPQNWNAGMELAYSDYSDSPIDLDVFQIEPHFGFYFSALGKRLYTEARFYYIHKDANVGVSMDNFYSFEQVLSTYVGKADFKLSGWVGQQIFAVRNGGFVVYNLSDRYLGGVEFEAGYKLTAQIRAAININQQWLEHVNYNDKASQTIFTVSIGGSF